MASAGAGAFADIALKMSKIAMRMVLIGAVIAAILIALGAITIPTPDFTIVSSALGKALAIIYHWVPGASVFIPITVEILSISLVIITIEIFIIIANLGMDSLGSD